MLLKNNSSFFGLICILNLLQGLVLLSILIIFMIFFKFLIIKQHYTSKGQSDIISLQIHI